MQTTEHTARWNFPKAIDNTWKIQLGTEFLHPKGCLVKHLTRWYVEIKSRRRLERRCLITFRPLRVVLETLGNIILSTDHIKKWNQILSNTRFASEQKRGGFFNLDKGIPDIRDFDFDFAFHSSF